jgi:hypothetical protein
MLGLHKDINQIENYFFVVFLFRFFFALTVFTITITHTHTHTHAHAHTHTYIHTHTTVVRYFAHFMDELSLSLVYIHT